MPTDQNPKQLVAQRLKDANNILVTVSRDPGVDELAAALALTLILDKLGKTPTAVFSGKIPPAIDFLEPGKTFNTNVDSLRDFIIALDKEKADRLRYKVEDDVVRVFITPYKTTITEKDLTFTQGDFNVDLIVAFGVVKREDLDTAITAHGRILHDAAVITVNQSVATSSLGEIDWSDPDASSLSEMLMSLTESLQSGLLDKPISTAILTGLVSVTDRFRNEHTTPKVMTMAAQLMAAGANQQLIAEKLEEAETVTTGKLNDAAPESKEPKEAAEPPKKSSDGEMKVDHGEFVVDETKDAVDRKAAEVAYEQSIEAFEEAEEAEERLKKTADVQLPAVQADEPPAPKPKPSSWRDTPATPPVEQTPPPVVEAVKEASETPPGQTDEQARNHVILSHDAPAVGIEENRPPALNASSLPPVEPTVNDIFGESTAAQAPTPPLPAAPVTPSTVKPLPEPVLQFEETPLPTATKPAVQTNPTLADLEEQVRQQEAPTPSPAAPAPTPAAPAAPAVPAEVDVLENARAAVDAALGTQPFNPAGQPMIATGAQPLGEIQHEAPVQEAPTVPPAATAPIAPPPLPPLPPLPDFSAFPLPPDNEPTSQAAPALPSFGLPDNAQPTAAPAVGTPPPADPGAFQLPGQG